MKLSLVATQGSGAGKAIPITLAQFVIGRDPQCHMRPASPLISKRHCALMIRGEKAFVRDFGSTNGTLVNGQRVAGESELHDGDRLQIGPMAFVVRVESSKSLAPIPKPPPRPGRSRAASALEEDSINDVLLDMPNESTPAVSSGTADMMPTMRDFVLPRPGPGPSKPGDKKPEPPKRPNPGGSR